MATPHPHRDHEYDGGAAAWGFLWVLLAFKLITVALIFYHLHTVETAAILAATTWYWLPVVVALVAGPLLFRYRLRRVRARRDQLRRAEWMLGQEQDVDETLNSRR